jgi:hypothetical protein
MFGTSCFPLSPSGNIKYNTNGDFEIDKNDQLSLILDFIGELGKDTLNFITEDNTLEYV